MWNQKISEMIRVAASGKIVWSKSSGDQTLELIEKQGPGIIIYVLEQTFLGKRYKHINPSQWKNKRAAMARARKLIGVSDLSKSWSQIKL